MNAEKEEKKTDLLYCYSIWKSRHNTLTNRYGLHGCVLDANVSIVKKNARMKNNKIFAELFIEFSSRNLSFDVKPGLPTVRDFRSELILKEIEIGVQLI